MESCYPENPGSARATVNDEHKSYDDHEDQFINNSDLFNIKIGMCKSEPPEDKLKSNNVSVIKMDSYIKSANEHIPLSAREGRPSSKREI